MSRCVFAPEARADLAEIHDYIARYSPDDAVQFVRRLEEHCLRLADHPYAGAARPDLGPEFRLSAVPRTRYVIIYLPMDDGVEIVLVRHGARDIRRLFE